jgi:hypothetical protein
VLLHFKDQLFSAFAIDYDGVQNIGNGIGGELSIDDGSYDLNDPSGRLCAT